jgi:hypothetical protein
MPIVICKCTAYNYSTSIIFAPKIITAHEIIIIKKFDCNKHVHIPAIFITNCGWFLYYMMFTNRQMHMISRD